MEYYGYQMVPVDFFRRHFLVYDAAYTKIGSLDCKRGVWTFTLAETSETWFGYSRDNALRNWILDPDREWSVPFYAPRAFLGLKTAL